MRLAVGSDDAGYPIKEVIVSYLRENGVEVVDFGPPDDQPIDYPDIAFPVAEAVGQGLFDRGILVCGTGIGMSISANKVPGVRAALCHDVYSAERARKSNDAQILTMGARVIGPELAKSIVSAWLKSEFEDGRSTRKVRKIAMREQNNSRRLSERS
jgi:ribose 5-phosphate isomerase B